MRVTTGSIADASGVAGPGIKNTIGTAASVRFVGKPESKNQACLGEFINFDVTRLGQPPQEVPLDRR
jgi:hypothetical protein